MRASIGVRLVLTALLSTSPRRLVVAALVVLGCGPPHLRAGGADSMPTVQFQDSWDRIECACTEYRDLQIEIDRAMHSQAQRMIQGPSPKDPKGVVIRLLHPKELIELTNRPRVLAVQIAENLRAALNYIVYHLSEQNDEALNVKHPAFVIADDVASFQKSSVSALKYLTAEQRQIVEGLQPYRGHSYMQLIRDTSNPSKHRGLLTLRNFTPTETVLDNTVNSDEYKGWWHFPQPNGSTVYVKRGEHDVQLLGKYNALAALKYMIEGARLVTWAFERYLSTGKFPEIVTD